MERLEMSAESGILSVAEAARLCGMSRGTVGYWIRKKGLHAIRTGRKYKIPVEDLLVFLKSTGKKIPRGLGGGELRGPFFKTVQKCMKYWQGSEHGNCCKDCTVFINQLETCFAARGSSRLKCNVPCTNCQYYHEILHPRISFVHQIDFPAAVYNESYLWGGNRRWAELCNVPEKDLPGMGIEQIVHGDSLGAIIRSRRKRKTGDPDLPGTHSIFLKNKQGERMKVLISIFPLTEPRGTHLVLAEERDS